MHDRAGQGASAFRAFLRGLPDDIAKAREDGLPVELVVDVPLEPHQQRLMDSLGVRVEVKSVTSTLPLSGRNMGSYIVPGPTFAPQEGPRADWIDYRASIASVHRREQNGDEPLTCPSCGTETDVTDVVHSPKCATLAPPVQKKASAWTADEAIAALQVHAATHGETPSLDDWRMTAPGRPTQAVIVRLFGTWLDGVRAAGLEPRRRGRPKRTADADAHEEAAAVLRGIRERHSARDEDDEEIGGSDGQGAHPRPDSSPDAAATTEATLPSPESPRQRGGARRGSGRPPVWDEARAVELIRSLAKNGVAPSAAETEKAGLSSYPIKRLGGFAHLVERAGLQRRGHGAASPAAQERQQPPIVWAVKVNGTGLRYRSVDEALVAAVEIEHDGEQVAQRAREDGQDGKADQAIDASRELAQKIREAAGASTVLAPQATSQERDPASVGAGRSRSSDAVSADPPPTRSRGAARAHARSGQRVLRAARRRRDGRQAGAPVTLRLVEQLKLEHPVQRPRDVLLHPLYGHHRRDERAPVTCDADLVAWPGLDAVLGLAKVGARTVAQLVAHPHRRKLTSRTPW